MTTADKCLHCGEAFGPDEPRTDVYVVTWAEGESGLRARHIECAQRQAIGGLNHLRGTCQCCGGTDDPDPPEMTKREAAIAAVNYWRLTRS